MPTTDTRTLIPDPPELAVRVVEGQWRSRRGALPSHAAHAAARDDDEAADGRGVAALSPDTPPLPRSPHMSRSTRITRTVTAALAIAALAAPTAFAKPTQDLRSPDTKDAAGQAQAYQDLRSPDTKDAAAQARTLQDLRSPDARDAATRPQPRIADRDLRTSSLAGTASPPPKSGVYWSYDYEAENPASARPAPVRVADGDDSDAPWLTIGIAIAAAMLGAAGGAVASSRTHRSRVAA